MDWKAIFAAVKQHAASAYPEQACGLILKDGTVIDCENIFQPASLRGVRYAVDDKLAYDYANHDKLFGFYHSHVNGTSDLIATDVYDAGKFPGMRHVIVGMLEGAPTKARVFVAMYSPLGVILAPCGPVDEGDADRTA
jgi:proteasome lid subunit RPN8/RPN11